MPPARPPAAARKPYFYSGHRRPSQNRPVVFGGLFTNRETLPSSAADRISVHRRPPNPLSSPTIDFRDWDPELSSPSSSSSVPSLPDSDRRLSPLARFICDSLRRHSRWCPAVLTDLQKLRRVTPDLVSEVLKSRPLLPPSLSTRFFHWAARQKGFSHTFASYNAFAYSLSAAGLFRAADQVPELMLAQGKPPTEKQLEILVRFHADARRPLRLFHLYRKMRTRFGVSPRRTFLYNRIIDALVSCGRLDLGLEVYDDLRADDELKEDAVTFTIICKGFCRAGRIDELVDLIGRMRSEVCRPDVFAYTAMIRILISAGNVDGGIRVWDEMKKDGVEADVMAYSTLISGLCKAGMMEKSEELFREMKKKGLLIERAVYGALVEGFVAEGKVETGVEIFREMVGDGYRADLGIYDLLIGGFCSDGRVDKAFKIFQIVALEGIVPEFTTVSPLLIACAEGHDMDMFFQLLDRISGLGLSVLDHLSSFFSAFLVKGGREMKALKIFNDLKSKGYCSLAIYNILIEALHKINELKKALSLFEELKDTEHLRPDSATYSLLITCIAEDGDSIKACSYFNKMKENCWTPTVAAYSSLVRGLCRIGEINAAMNLVKDCLGSVTSGPMEFKYSLRVLDACRSGKPEKVMEVLDEMVEQGYPLEDIIYCTVIYGFCKYSSSGEARQVFQFLKKRNIFTEANFIIYEEMLNEHLKKETAGLVISGLKFFGLEKKLKWATSLDETC
ncbi:LOW QUALITY PROTEIN: pentatricopeptide repeat-containing protein At4g20740 [Phalaenopsis equestris]|uniref:LOW QUALITY PROTEIN: pentatricopeptide repeat-containing protein At4g20740 n=1 Tax=Phalaenopsis equestris TaxID=78828 RepID=UPI0009E24967|nr:LOW QUALITY PROTEIN: pentatricopeptide repeat-containing protein At4g20740 [Phalaenopsis equestris]